MYILLYDTLINKLLTYLLYLQTVYIIKNNDDFYSSCSKQNFNMQRHPAMSEQKQKED